MARGSTSSARHPARIAQPTLLPVPPIPPVVPEALLTLHALSILGNPRRTRWQLGREHPGLSTRRRLHNGQGRSPPPGIREVVSPLTPLAARRHEGANRQELAIGSAPAHPASEPHHHRTPRRQDPPRPPQQPAPGSVPGAWGQRAVGGKAAPGDGQRPAPRGQLQFQPHAASAPGAGLQHRQPQLGQPPPEGRAQAREPVAGRFLQHAGHATGRRDQQHPPFRRRRTPSGRTDATRPRSLHQRCAQVSVDGGRPLDPPVNGGRLSSPRGARSTGVRAAFPPEPRNRQPPVRVSRRTGASGATGCGVAACGTFAASCRLPAAPDESVSRLPGSGCCGSDRTSSPAGCSSTQCSTWDCSFWPWSWTRRCSHRPRS